jgi:hypothetical protein
MAMMPPDQRIDRKVLSPAVDYVPGALMDARETVKYLKLPFGAEN